MATERVPFPFLGSSGAKNPIFKWLEPKDFHIVWGEDPEFWTLPNDDDPTAKLIRVNWLEVIVKVTMPVPLYARIKADFEISKTDYHSGWGDYSDVFIGFKTKTMDNYHLCSIKDQINSLRPNQKGLCTAFFDFYAMDDQTLEFAFLHTDTTTQKRGLVFYRALAQTYG